MNKQLLTIGLLAIGSMLFLASVTACGGGKISIFRHYLYFSLWYATTIHRDQRVKKIRHPFLRRSENSHSLPNSPLFDSLFFLSRRIAAKQGIAMRKAAKLFDNVVVVSGETQIVFEPGLIE